MMPTGRGWGLQVRWGGGGNTGQGTGTAQEGCGTKGDGVVGGGGELSVGEGC